MKRSADKTASSVGDTQQPLREHEWKFDGVPKEQLEACYLYEYAREFFNSSKHLQRFLKEWNNPNRQRTGKALMARRKALDLLRTRCENLPYIDFDFFPNTAWQDLPVLPRTEYRGFEIDLRQEATEQVNEWAARNRKCHSDRLHIETLRESAPPNIRTIEAFRRYHDIFNDMWGKQDLSNTEYGFFAINWNFKNSQIVNAFTDWLSDQRKARKDIGLKDAKPTVSRGGFADKLKWLGALRVFEFYKKHRRLKEWVSYPDQMLNINAPYCYYPDLLDAAKKATKEINRLFPSQWSEKDFWHRQAETDRWIKEHPLVRPEATVRTLIRS
jgi:hypothetical protein